MSKAHLKEETDGKVFKTLVVIRHAKSGWADSSMRDFERPLNERGKKDATEMGQRLFTNKIIPDLIISSPAKRTKETARRMADAVGFDKNEIKWVDELYHGLPLAYEETLERFGANHDLVFIIGHNPGITQLVNGFSQKFQIDNVPTCGVALVKVFTDDWNNFRITEKEVLNFDAPKII